MSKTQPEASRSPVSEVERVYLEIRERMNHEHAEGIISYRELKAGVNAAALMRDAVLTAPQPQAPSEERRICTVCTAVVARFDEVMCCHCHEIPWKVATDMQPVAGGGE